MSTSVTERGYAIVEELRRCGITHFIYLAEGTSMFIYDAIASHPAFKLIPVCREGETMPIAQGLIIGGKNPVINIQSTGFLESGDSFRGFMDAGFPLLLLIGHRSWTREGPVTDSVVRSIEKILDAWDIKYYILEPGDDVRKISDAYSEARKMNKPVAVLIAR